ncbi:hypothetical protein LIER_17989 [Lithospermum erythrorhizon]|uniref:Uncharacterized protein n=1 Tax=Lithospermum erythrorhizon TaxID=34254 RepID=A0AAV3QHW6_LITER
MGQSCGLVAGWIRAWRLGPTPWTVGLRRVGPCMAMGRRSPWALGSLLAGFVGPVSGLVRTKPVFGIRPGLCVIWWSKFGVVGKRTRFGAEVRQGCNLGLVDGFVGWVGDMGVRDLFELVEEAGESSAMVIRKKQKSDADWLELMG